MQYMHTCIYTSEGTLPYFTHPTSYVRNVITDLETITENDLNEYMKLVGCLGKTNASVISHGTVPSNFNIAGLSIEDNESRPKFALSYDYFFTNPEDLEAYLKYVGEYIESEKNKPAKFSKKPVLFGNVFKESQDPNSWSSPSACLMSDSALLPGINYDNESTFETFEKAYGRITFSKYTEFDKGKSYDDLIGKPTKYLLRLSSSLNKIVEDRADGYWCKYAGTSVYPDIKIVSKLFFYKNGVSFTDEKGFTENLRMDTNTLKFVEEMLVNISKSWGFSFREFFAFIKTLNYNGLKEYYTEYTKDSTEISQSMGGMSEYFKSFFNNVRGKDNEMKELRGLLNLFKESPDKNIIQDFFTKSKRDACLKTLMLDDHIFGCINVEFLIESFNDMQFLDSSKFEHVKLALLLRLFERGKELQLYEYEKENREFIFETVIKIFMDRYVMKDSTARTNASTLRDGFNGFLKGVKQLAHVAEYGNQSYFNNILKSLGWEQKRLANGKVWIGAKYSEEPCAYVQKSFAEIVEAAKVLGIPIPSRTNAIIVDHVDHREFISSE
jgi:hypothetical protein